MKTLLETRDEESRKTIGGRFLFVRENKDFKVYEQSNNTYVFRSTIYNSSSFEEAWEIFIERVW